MKALELPDGRALSSVGRVGPSAMTRYLISFDHGAMTFPEEDLPDVARASHAVVAEAKAAGVWVTGGGIETDAVVVVDVDGSMTDGPARNPHSRIGGFSVLDVPSHEEALRWAARIAESCRCAQEVRALMDDPDV